MGSAPSGCPIRGNFNFNYETAASTPTTRPSRRLNHATTAPLKLRNHHAPPTAQPQRARGISPWDPNPLNCGFASILTHLIGLGPRGGLAAVPHAALRAKSATPFISGATYSLLLGVFQHYSSVGLVVGVQIGLGPFPRLRDNVKAGV